MFYIGSYFLIAGFTFYLVVLHSRVYTFGLAENSIFFIILS